MEAMNEAMLWRSFICQHFDDATCAPSAMNGSHGRTQDANRIINEAREFLTTDGRRFSINLDTACDLAGIEPTSVRQRALDLASAGWPRDAVAGLIYCDRLRPVN